MKASAPAPDLPPAGMLAAGDHCRRLAVLAIAGSLAIAAVFEAALFASKETPAVYDHAPWLNDPYDTAVSFALFCVPLIAIPSALRLLACRPGRPTPAARLADLLRACGVALVLVAATLAGCWAAVAEGANRRAWNSTAAVQVGWLAALTVCALAGAAAIRRAAVTLAPSAAAAGTHQAAGASDLTAPDWLTDLVSATLLLAMLAGPVGRPTARVLRWIADRALPLIRRHPMLTAGLAGAAFAVPVTIAQSVNESYQAGIATIFFCILTAGVFAFMATAGWYLRVVRINALPAGSSPVARATVLAAAAVPVALAFRATLWSLVGVSPDSSGLPALGLLLASAAVLAFALSLAAGRVVRSRRGASAGAR